MKLTSQTRQPTSNADRAAESSPKIEQPVLHIGMNSHYAGWMLLPLRLFLGITFVYAGIQKLADPQFFRSGTPGYIGNQLIAFAHNTPLHDLLTRVGVPHAVLIGLIVAFGELAIGWATLLGILFRPAAFFGLVLSLLFFLSASWHTYPYFYGADIVFVFCWLTLLLKGPLNTGLPTVDGWLLQRFFPSNLSQRQGVLSLLLQVILGRTESKALVEDSGNSVAQQSAQFGRTSSATRSGTYQVRNMAARRTREKRRSFLLGLFTGGVGLLGVGAFGLALRTLLHVGDDTLGTGRSQTPVIPTATTPQAGSTPATAGSGTVIGKVSAIPKNNATTFTIPSSGDPGVLIHLNNDQFVAYDATCTHAGCPVDYDPSSHSLQCPCHGAAFDPAQGAAVLQGPASTPLTSVAIHVDSATGAISLQ